MLAIGTAKFFCDMANQSKCSDESLMFVLATQGCLCNQTNAFYCNSPCAISIISIFVSLPPFELSLTFKIISPKSKDTPISVPICLR